MTTSHAIPMQPYKREKAGKRFKPLQLTAIAVYAAANGALITFLPPSLLFILAIPIGLMVAVVFWLLPDTGNPAPTLASIGMLVAYAAANCLWPHYLAIDLPGLPWINPPRLLATCLLGLSITYYSSSGAMRNQLSDTLATISPIRFAFWCFWFITLLTIPFSDSPAWALNKWFNNQIYWTALFLVALWLFPKPGVMSKFATVLVLSSIVLCIETLYEVRIGRVPWADHIPSFLRVDEAYLAKVLESQSRAGTDIYRARGTFSVSLILAEYLSLVYPFAIFLFAKARLFGKFALGCGLILMLAVMWFTNARSGMIGFFMSVLLCGAIYAYKAWRTKPSSLGAVSGVAAIPFAGLLFLLLAIFWPRLHNMTFGGGQHEPSTLARELQWSMGWPMVLANPIGHGPGSAATVLGFANGQNDPTIDSYYLTLLLEYGVLGFACFLVLFGSQAYYGIRAFIKARDDEEAIAGVASIALLNFLVIKSVLSSDFNLPIAFMFLAMVIVIVQRQTTRTERPSLGIAPVIEPKITGRRRDIRPRRA